jgi:hypothetical protein
MACQSIDYYDDCINVSCCWVCNDYQSLCLSCGEDINISPIILYCILTIFIIAIISIILCVIIKKCRKLRRKSRTIIIVDHAPLEASVSNISPISNSTEKLPVAILVT